MKKTILLITILALFSFSSIAQISRGGFPKFYEKDINELFTDTTASKDKDNLDKHTIKINIEAKHEKDKADLAVSDCKTCTLPYYGSEIPLKINFFDQAKSKKLKDGSELWILKLSSKDWHGFQFFFDNFYLPEGSELFLFNDKKDMELGAFTSLNNRYDGQFITQPLLGNKVYIEYFKPSNITEQAILKLGAVVCIFDDAFLRKGPFAKEASPPCNANTVCPEAFGWESEAKSVGLILEKDGSNNYWGLCSGALINKSDPYLGTDKPLFLSANHCYENYNDTTRTSTYRNTNNWVFLFRHEGLTCSDDGSTITKSLTKSVTGATVLKADINSKTSDYLLLRLNCTVDQISNYDVSFAGWSKNEFDGYSDKTVTIHHPQGDIKKFTYTTIVPTSASNTFYNNTYSGGANAMWKIIWTNGVTAPGSSGGPLFNSSHQIIGQLYVGASTCENPWLSDYYGKLSTSFLYGNFQTYLGVNTSVSSSTPSRPALDLSISTNPSSVTPSSNVSFTATSANKFGTLHCWWIINTEQGDVDVTCNANTDAYCYASNTNPTQTFTFNSAGNYKITLWATDDSGKQGSKELFLNVSDATNTCISVNIWGKNDCANTRIFSLGSNLQLTDYAYAEFCRIYSGGPLLYDGIKTIKWYYDGVLKTSYNFNKTSYCFESDNCYYPGYSPGCFSLNSVGKHVIKMEAYAGQLNSGTFVQVSPPSTISKEINVIDCSGTKEITTQTALNSTNGYIGDGIILLDPPVGSTLIVNSGSKLNVNTYNKAIIKPGVKFITGSSCLIKAYDCPTPDCGCTSLKNAKIGNLMTEDLEQNPQYNKITVYPNPTHKYTMVDLGDLFNDVSKIELIDAMGKTIFDQDCSIQQLNYLNTENLLSGMYFVKVTTSSGQVVKKLIKN